MKPHKAGWFYWCAGAVLVSDQLSKAAARLAIRPDRPVTVIPGLLSLDLSFNTGGAFGILPDWTPLFIIAALAAIFAIVRISRNGLRSTSLSAGLGLLMGGALGNLTDRLFTPWRGVTDFISLHVDLGGRVYAWPSFNLADAAIVVGAVLVLLNVYVIERARGASEG